VLVDEHPDSINDAAFAVQMATPSKPLTMGDVRIIDFPAAIITGLRVLVRRWPFRIHKWRGSKIRPPVTSQLLQLNVTAAIPRTTSSGCQHDHRAEMTAACGSRLLLTCSNRGIHRDLRFLEGRARRGKSLMAWS